MIPGIHKRFDPIRTLLWGLCLLQGALLAHSAPSLADVTSAITSDGTLGTSVSQAGNVFDIDGGTLKGTNQFHSFDRFDVGTGDIASFNGPNVVENILSRVTGLQSGLEESMIDGTLRSTIEGANLYLINPAGVLFGPNASLDLTGSFHISTADYLRLSDGARFNAMPGQADTVLTSAPVEAFGFLVEKPAPLLIEESRLQVPESETLSLIGGDIGITGGPAGFLAAQSGRISAVSVASPGEAVLERTGINVDDFEQLGEISIADDGFIIVSELSGVNGAGTVFIRGGNLTLDDSLILATTSEGDGGVLDVGVTENLTLASGSVISSATIGPGRSPEITIEVDGDLALAGNSVIASTTEGSGDSGNISLNVGNLHVSESSRVSTFTSSSGNAGDLTVTASDTISIKGDSFTALVTDSIFDTGNAGDIDLNAKTLTIDGGVISAESGPFSLGQGGDIAIDVERLELANEARVTSGSRGAGDGGNLTVSATEGISLSDFGTVLQSTASGSGNAGDIAVTTPDLRLVNRSAIQSSTFSNGAGGDISITTDRLTLANSQIDSSAIFRLDGQGRWIPSSGQAGNISVVASDSILLINETAVDLTDDPSSAPRITSTTFGTGNAGAIKISAPSLIVDNGGVDTNTLSDISLIVDNGGGETDPGFGEGDASRITIDVDILNLRNGGNISSSTGLGTTGVGGEVTINATESISISGAAPGPEGLFKSSISSVTLGQGKAGTINISAPILSIDLGAVEAFTESTGDAGTVNLTADRLSLTRGGTILAFTIDAGDGGRVQVSANSISITGTDPNDGTPSGIFADATEGSTGSAGTLAVTASSVELSDGAEISTSTGGSGVAGPLILNVDSLTVQGGSAIRSISTGVAPSATAGSITIEGREEGSAATVVEFTDSTLSTSAAGASAGGDITVNAGQVMLSDAQVSATTDRGDAGAIVIEGGTLQSTSARITTETNEGKGGSIDMSAAGSLTLTGTTVSAVVDGGDKAGGNITLAGGEMRFADGTDVTASRGGTGSIGNITIGDQDTVNLQLRESRITTDAENVSGGNIKINAQNIVGLTDASEISASVVNGDGGNVVIDPEFTILNRGSAIRANADAGRGGNITIDGIVIRSADSVIEATGTEPGTVDVDAQEDVISNVTALPAEFQDPARRLRQRCGERVDVGRSTFGEVGLDGLPLSPEAYLSATVPLPPASEQASSLSRPLTDLGETHVPFISCRDD